MTIHTTFPKGKSVHIIMKDGKHLTGQYVDKSARHVHFTIDGQAEKIKISKIRSTSIER